MRGEHALVGFEHSGIYAQARRIVLFLGRVHT